MFNDSSEQRSVTVTVDDEGVEAGVGAVAGDEGGVLGEDLVEGGLLVALDGGGDDGLPVGALDEVEEVAVEVAAPLEKISITLSYQKPTGRAYSRTPASHLFSIWKAT